MNSVSIQQAGMRVNRYFPFVFIYFFINSLALPFGLTYTSLLAPFFYVWILLVRKKEIVLPFLAILAPFIILHIAIVDVEKQTYFLSLLNLLLVYISCQAVYTFLKVCNNPEEIFRKILILNFIFCLIAIPFYFTTAPTILWQQQAITMGLKKSRRLQLFTYEPSFYALLFTPFFFFFFLKYLFRQNTIPRPLLFAMLFLPYVLSFSVGVMGSIVVSFLLVWLIYFRRLTRKRRILNVLINTGVTLVSVLFLMGVFFRKNALFFRLGNIASGEDSSGKGRTADAFIIADKLLRLTNEYWGVGLGQVKLVGETIIRDYYLYYENFSVAIPNAAAETLAIFGWVGFCLRIAIELFLFFHTKVWRNYYRLSLFFFIFIYQFTGSFITNLAEYVVWILAFTPVFTQFDIFSKKQEVEHG